MCRNCEDAIVQIRISLTVLSHNNVMLISLSKLLVSVLFSVKQQTPEI